MSGSAPVDRARTASGTHSILFWLRVLVLVCVLPAWAITTWIIVASGLRERNAREQSTIETARALTQAVDRDLASSVAGLQALATSTLLADRDLAGFYRQAVEALPNLAGRTIVLVDPNGQELVNTSVAYGHPLPRIAGGGVRSFEAVFRTGKPAISDLFTGSLSHRPILAIGVPVILDGTVAYFLAMGIAPRSLSEILRRQDFPTNWVAAIVDSTGAFVARTHDGEQFIGKKVAPAFLSNIADKHEGVYAGVTQEGVSAVAGFSRSTVSGWTVGIAIPTSELMAPLYRSLWLTISAAAALLLLALPIAWFISSRIAGSIRALSEPALALAADTPVLVPPQAIREVNEIGDALVKASRLLEERRIAREEAEQAQRNAAVAKAFAGLNDAGLRLWQAQTLQEGLDEILSATIDLLGADMGNIQILDSSGKALHIAAQRGFEQDFLTYFRELSAAHNSARGRALRTGVPVVIDDIDLDVDYAPFRPVARAAGYRAVVAAPLIGKGGALLGVTSAHFRLPHRPSATELQNLDLYVRLASAFIERFEAEDALRESIAKLAAETKAVTRFTEAGLRLWEGKRLQEGLDATLAGTIDLLGADMGAVQLLDSEGKLLRLAAHRGFNQEFLDYFREVRAEQDSAVGRALHTGEPIIVADTELDSAFQFRAIREAAGYRAFVAAPLVSSRGPLLGLLSAHFRAPHRPSDSEMQWLELYRRRAADFIQRLEAQEALRESEERLRLALEAGGMAAFDLDIRTRTTVWNDEFYRMYGYCIGEVQPSRAAWLSRIHPEDREAAETVVANAQRDRKSYINEFRIVLPNGKIRWIRAHGRFLSHGDELIRTFGLVEDITEARLQMETQRVLVAELQHRTRNLMAVVHSIAHQTLDNAKTLAEFEDQFDKRLQALSRVQSLLSRTDHESITFGALVTMEMEAIGEGTFKDRIAVEGPVVSLRKSVVEMLSLAIHELLTNSIKYGALASPIGHLSVRWRIEGTPPDRRLAVEWIELGIAPPPHTDAGRRGYGRTLIEEALPYSLSGETTFDLGSDRLRCQISLPLATEGGVW